MTSITTCSNFFRLSAVQGNADARTELYNVLRGSTGAVDAVVRQEGGV